MSKKDYNVPTVWFGTILEKTEHDAFKQYFKEEFDTRVDRISQIKAKDGSICVLFYIHKDDVTKFTTKRLRMPDVKWLTDYENEFSKTVLNKIKKEDA